MRRIGVVGLWLLLAASVAGQTTQGLIRGRVVDSLTSQPVEGRVECKSIEGTASIATASDKNGYYAFPLLSPGTYQLRVTAPAYQAQDVHELSLPVAGVLEIDFELRPESDVWERGRYLRSAILPSGPVLMFFGPDVDTSLSSNFDPARGRSRDLESSLSGVVSSQLLRAVPLNGRDPYALLMAMPGVTSESATGKGLGFSVNGQRPTASNFLLDGVENNNTVTAGALIAPPPEAIQEYRISTNNFSAEYGRATGFVANVITHSGGAAWHGLGYFYFKNQSFNANDFQRNRQGILRPLLHEWQPGISVGGPVRRAYASLAAEHIGYSSESLPTRICLPSASTLAQAPDNPNRRLLEKYLPALSPAPGPTACDNRTIPRTSRRTFVMPRLDLRPRQGHEQLAIRANWNRYALPDFVWSPYPEFVMPLTQTALALMSSYTRPLLGGVNEFRAGFSRDHLSAERPQPNVPYFSLSDSTLLPGAQAFYGYRHDARMAELSDSLRWNRGRHLVSVGGGLLLRQLDSELSAYRDGEVIYDNLTAFLAERLFSVRTAVARGGLVRDAPSYLARYQFTQSFLFLQDSFRATRGLTFSIGIRYERFGVPRHRANSAWTELALGPGVSFLERIAAARFHPRTGGPLYGADENNWAPRFGVSWSPRPSWSLRGAYGTFFDRPFDNLWQTAANNGFEVRSFPYANTVTPLPADFRTALASRTSSTAQAFTKITLFQPNLRTPYVHSYLLAVEHRLSPGVSLRLAGSGSLGRKLITTDLVNRLGTGPRGTTPNTTITSDMLYRANQGLSSNHALTAVALWRRGALAGQFGYTWSHTIDNQSDALAGEFYRLSALASASRASGNLTTGFLRQFDSRADRGNAAFDQRQSLFIAATWPMPALPGALRPLSSNWTLASLTAARSGLPYSVLAPNAAEIIAGLRNNRASLVAAAPSHPAAAIPGGRQILARSDFAVPTGAGNLGRNALAGPAFFNADVSLSRTISWKDRTFTVRADAFNLLNHVNLASPSNTLTNSNFGAALYGRQGYSTGFAAQLPFDEPARQLQLMLRFEF